MAKRRTRKQKISAQHKFSISWSPEAQKDKTEPNVKGQITKTTKSKPIKAGKAKSAKSSAKDRDLVKIKRDIIKSLIFAGIILGTEIVIYLAWTR